jgi:hypothetical protein
LTVTVWPATVSVAVRGEVTVLAAMEKATVPLPDPLAPDVIVSQDELSVAVQLQPVVVVTLTLLVLAASDGFRVVGATVKTQGAAAWVTVRVCPAIVSVPVRGDVTVLAAMEKATVPLPDPLAPDVIVSQASLLVAVHEQPLVVVTVALLDPAVAAGFKEVGEIEKAQGAAA